MPRERKEAARHQVRHMKSFLGSKVLEEDPQTENHNYDNSAIGTNVGPTATLSGSSLPPLKEDFLWLCLNHVANPNRALFTAVNESVTCRFCSGNFVRNSLNPRESSAWRIHGCENGKGHFLHVDCLKLIWKEQFLTLDCTRCEVLGRQIQVVGIDELDKRLGRIESLLMT